jgi:Flp pilus assembly protein TadG
MAIRGPDLSLVRDALNRSGRTALQQLVVLATDVAIVLGLDLTDLDTWQVLLLVAYHLVASVVAAYVHRSALDPTSMPSLAPPDTPTFREPELPPPVPMG